MHARSLGMTRRSALRLAGASAALAILNACSTGSVPTVAPTVVAPTTAPPAAPSPTSAGSPATAASGSVAASPGATTAPQPKSGGTLTVGRLADIEAPDRSLMASQSYIMTAQLYNALIHYDAKQMPQPELAESWELSADGKQLKINLRRDVLFHSGREFTSDDVKYNTIRVRDTKLGMSQLTTMSNWVTDIQTPDKYTVTYMLDQPRAAIFDLLHYLFIVDKETAEGPDAAHKGGGTGPFSFAEWVPGQHIRFAKNKNYWLSGRPYLDEVVVQIITDPQALGVQLESGALDLAELLPERDIARLRSDPGYRVVLNELSGQFYVIQANTSKPPMDNKMLRQAINYAVDRNQFVRTLLAGIGAPAATPWPPQSAAYNPAKNSAYAYNLDKAQALIKQSGVAGTPFTYLSSPAFPDLANLGQILQADLAKLGVKMAVESPELAAYNKQVNDKSYTGLSAATFAYADLTPSSLLIMAAPFNAQTSPEGDANDQYKQLIVSAMAELDPAKRTAIYGQITDLLLDQSVVIPLAQRKGTLIMRTRTHGAGFRTSTTQVVRLEEAWKEA